MDKEIMIDKYNRWLTIYVGNNYNILKTCEDYGIHYQGYLKWRKDPIFMEMLSDTRQGLLELAENVLRKAAAANDTDAAKFIITKLGRKRDWSPDQQQLDITTDGKALPATINIIMPKED